ncbi:MAG: phage portal protein family protein [Candidatus Kapaibacteriota bacterium]
MIENEISKLNDIAERPFWASYFSTLPPIDKALARIGASGFSVLRQIYYDPFVYGAIQSRKSGVLMSDWAVRGEGSEEVISWLSRLDVSKLIEEVLDSIYFGFQVFEVNWSEDLVPVEVKQCYPELFRIVDGQLVYVGSGREQVFPKQKFISVTFGENLYEIYGSALLSKVYYYWLFLKESTKMWVKYVEKFGIPIADVKMVGNEDEQRKIAQIIREAVGNAVVVHDPNVELSYVDVNEKDGAIFTNLIEHCKNAISVAILGHERGMQSTSGKLGNEKMAMEVRSDLVRQDKRVVERFFDTLIKYYWEFRSDSEQPYFYFVENEDLQLDRAKRDQILAQIGVVFSPEYWKRQYGLGDEDVLFEAEVPAIVRKSDEAIREAVNKDPVGFNEWLGRVEKYLNGKDFELARDGLLDLYGELSEGEYLKRMEKLLVWAYMQGAKRGD